MKIALVFYNLSMPAGGQRQFLSLAQMLKTKGHRVVVFSVNIDKNIYPDLWRGIDVRVLDGSSRNKLVTKGNVPDFFWGKVVGFFASWRNYNNLAFSMSEMMDNDFDVVNCHEDFAYKVGLFYKEKNKKARVIWTLNNVPYFYAPEKNFLKNVKKFIFVKLQDLILEKKYFKAVDRVCVLSKYEERWAKERNLNVQVIRSGLDFDFFYSLVKKFVGEKQTVKLLSIGILGRHRRFEDTLLATKILKEKGFDVKTSIICKEIDKISEEDYKNYLLKFVEENSLYDCVNFNFDGVSESVLPKVYSQNDIFVHPVFIPPPQYYGWGLAVFEAIAAGLPVVLCNVTGATEVLEDGKTALFAKPLSGKSFADKIELLIKTPTLYKKIASDAQVWVKENISWMKYADNMEELFLELKNIHG